jgi:hypothetical protein
MEQEIQVEIQEKTKEKQVQGDTLIDSSVKEAIKNEVNTVNYTPMSTLPSLGTVIPINLLGETIEAQSNILLQTDGKVDDYLMTKLKYRSKIALGEAFAAEQADAIVMAIKQIENGESLILGDQAGTGKGRVCAGILRYAYVNGYLPIFITEKDNLFTDIYRDIVDIRGIGALKRDKQYLGTPLILNGYVSGGNEIDADGKKIKKAGKTSILDKNGQELIIAPDKKVINEIIKTGELPKEYDFIMLTYSQLAARKTGLKKYEYLLEVGQSYDGKFIIVMDESHNAAGSKSATGEKIRGLVSKSFGCLFSSATFSKTPENMYLYAMKTDLRKANIDTKQLLEVIKTGGERLIENMAASLAKGGQLLTRLRRFDNCTVEYKFMDESDKKSLFEKYDKTLGIYRELLAYFNLGNLPFYQAKYKAINRFAKSKKVELCTEPMPTAKDAKKGKELDALIVEWEKRNKGKYMLSRYTAGEINRTQFNFIETLLFALKSEFVVKLALQQLYGNPNYPDSGENWSLESKRVSDKTIFKSNRKPVIAVRNTLEGIYNTLGLRVGSIIDDGDFIVYIRAIIQGALNGVLTLYEIRTDDKEIEISDEYPIELDDFEDKGERYLKFIEDLKGVKLNIPVSPIDYLIQEIESKKRDAKFDKYGGGNPYFKVAEVTGRTKRLIRLDDGRYKLIENPKDKNVSKSFKKFNDGIADVLLINESGSTGASAHSSSTFTDQRPRCMIIHQVELDVNQEVQKRGRINRTGMVNYPTYVYAISRIPSEIRRLLMLAKKLRKLDANTTGNQKQSKALSQIKDSEGNPIEDIINKYGDEVLNEFLEDPQNKKDYGEYKLEDEEKGIRKLSDQFEIESFIRQLELANAEKQEYFFNTINVLYKQKVEEKIEDKVYDLETELIDLRAQIINRTIYKQGENTNPFNSSVYLEDDKAFSQEVPMQKSEVDDYIKKLALNNEDAKKYYKSVYDDYLLEKQKHLEETLAEVPVPDYKGKSKEEKELLKIEYDEKIQNLTEKLEKDAKRVEKFFKFFHPEMPCKIPAFIEECYDVDEGEDGEGKGSSSKKITEWNNARFAGLIISKAATKYKYSAMNIEFVFCQLSGKSKVKFKPTPKGAVVLDFIVEKTRFIDLPSLELINLWSVDKTIRRFTRLITGNLIEGYSCAQYLIKTEEAYSKQIDFIKFTTADEVSIRFAIRLHLSPYKQLDIQNPKILYNINQDALLKIMLNPNEEKVKGSNSQKSVLVGVKKDFAQIYFLGGLQKYKGKSAKKDGVTSYYSKFYDDPQVKEIAKSYGITPSIYSDKLKFPEGDKPVNILLFQVPKISPVAEKFLKELLNYVASVLQIKIELKYVESEEIIKGEEDYKFTDEIEGKKDVEGNYGYKFLSPPDRYIESVTSSSKFLSIDKNRPPHGSVNFKFRPTVGEVVSWNIMPINPTQNEIVTDVLSILDDSDKINIRIALEKAVKEGKDNNEIGGIVIKYIAPRIFVKKSIFGQYDKKEDIGAIFRNFIEGKKEDLPEGKKEDIDIDIEIEQPKELDMDSAQDFILLLSSKI